MERSAQRWFVLRQIVIVAGSMIAYFMVRAYTEGEVSTASRNARDLLRFERDIGLDLEVGAQTVFTSTHVALTLANWVYIWLHWPVLIATLVWLLRRDRREYLWLRNAMIVSGAIGLVIFMTLPMSPPRLLDSTYLDTVTQYSHSYRVMQSPIFTNEYAAMPSLHFGWNLLAGIVWFGRSRCLWQRVVAVLMPAVMAVAVVATANHWVLDVVVGGVVALIGALIETLWRRERDRRVANEVTIR